MTGAEATTTFGGSAAEQSFLLQRVQPAMTGLIDGSLSTLAPIFSVALATHRPHYAFFAGLATAIGAGVSMAFSEGLSDTGDLTGRGKAYVRGSITGWAPSSAGSCTRFPSSSRSTAWRSSWRSRRSRSSSSRSPCSRWRFFHTDFLRSFASVALGGAIIAGVSAALGGAAA